MTWFVILGMILWLVILMTRVESLRARLDTLERKQARGVAPVAAESQAPVAPPAVAAAAERPPIPQPAPAAVVAHDRPPRATPSSRPAPSRGEVRAWLEENGLAWAGGAALAVGGLFLVTYAAQRGVFTPPFRIAAAVLAGALMLAVSEWLRRQASQPGGGHMLAAAVATGAGAATLYGAAWASYWLYAFIPLPAAGALMGLISLGLLGLAFVHGEPLAIVAISGGFLAPMITGPQHWAAPALTAELALVTAAGYAVAGARRWTRAGLATLAWAAIWALAGFAAEGYARVAALALAPAVLAFLAVEWRRRQGDTAEQIRSGGFAILPDAAVVTGSVLLLALWFAPMTPGALTAAGGGAAAMAVLAAIGSRRGVLADKIRPFGYAPIAGAALPFVRRAGAPAPRELWAGGLMLVGAGSGLYAAVGARTLPARLAASAGALAALVIVLVTQGPLTAAFPWAPAAFLAIVLVAFAAVLARTSEAPESDLALAVWIWIAGAAALYSLPKALDARILPIAAAALSTLAAALHRRLGWRGFAAVSIASAVGALAALVSRDIFEALHAGELRWWGMIAIAGVSAALVYAGARLADRNDRPKETADALSTGALLIALAGLFLVLRQQGMAGAATGSALDPFLEASLRTLLILAAGLLSAQGARADSSPIGRWRGQVFLLVGLAHGVFLQVLLLNPLLADWQPRVAGPRLLDSLAVGFLAPALLLGAATRKKVAFRRELLAIYSGGAGVFGLAWALLETRRLFQGASLQAGLDAVGRAEACAYAVILLLAARALLWAGETAAQRPWTISSLASQVTAIGRAAAWAALGVAFLVFAWGASPWWGPIDRPILGQRAAALLLAGYVAGAFAAHSLTRASKRDELLPRAGRLTVVVIGFALLNLVVRYAFHGLDMRARLQEMSLETWTYSAAWGLFGFGLLIYGAARRSNDLRGAGLVVLLATTAKIFLFDMARLEGVVRAGSFLAVGALLLAAAVLVRRLGGSETLLNIQARRSPASDESPS